MARRQRRFSAHEITPDVLELLNTPVSLILRNGKVFFVKVLKMENNALLVQDLGKLKRKILVLDIQELILEI